MVYLMYCTNADYCKIGFSQDNVPRRLVSIRNASPYDVQLYGVVEGSETLEKELHKIFAAHKVNREWFKQTSEIFDFFDSNRLPDHVVFDRAKKSLAKLKEDSNRPRPVANTHDTQFNDLCECLWEAWQHKAKHGRHRVDRLSSLVRQQIKHA